MTQKLYKQKENQAKLHSKSLKYGHHAESSPSSRSTAIASANSKSCWGIDQIGSNPVTHHPLHLQQCRAFLSWHMMSYCFYMFLYTCKKLNTSDIGKNMWVFKRNLLNKVEWAMSHELSLEEVVSPWLLPFVSHAPCLPFSGKKQTTHQYISLETNSWAHV